MARPRNFDESTVLEGAVEIFREKGYEGASVPELISRLGICRQSLYNTFTDKHGLYLQVLELWGRREVDAKIDLLVAEGSPLENVRTLIRGFAALAPSCPSEGCLTVTAMVETRDDPAVLAIVEEQVSRLEQGFGEALARARDLGELKASVRPERLARAITTTCYGMGLLSRLSSSGARIGDTVSVLLEQLEEVAT